MAEALDKGKRQLNLIVYNVQETAEENDNVVEAFCSLMDKCTQQWLMCNAKFATCHVMCHMTASWFDAECKAAKSEEKSVLQ